jgi:prepilin signal peptidase PulO-like enzyme (type II secretory pathway)
MLVYTVFAFLFGTIIGSFLNSLVLRWGTGYSMVDRSACFSCSTTLRWYELVPIGSFLVLRGRCRSCGTRISAQYPLVELLTGLLFALAFIVSGLVWQTLLMFAVFSLLVAILVYDIKHTIIPNGLVYTLIAISFLALFIDFSTVTIIFPSWSALLAGPILFIFFAALWLVSRGTWMGLGDAKLALALGWLLGLAGGISAIVFSFWSGALVGVGLLLAQKIGTKVSRGKLTLKSEIPFAPFLVLGFLLVYLGLYLPFF